MTIEVDLVYFDGCPHVDAAREALRQALAARSGSATFREWRSDDPALPAYAAGYGSPSIFVAGREVTGSRPSASPVACRLYLSAGGDRRGAPTHEAIFAALQSAGR